MDRRERLREHLGAPVERVDLVFPRGQLTSNERPRHGLHAAGKRVDLVLAVAAWRFSISGLGMGCHFPYRGHRRTVDLAHLSNRYYLAVLRKPLGPERLVVYPLSGGPVALDLQVLAQFLVPYGPALAKQSLHLLEDQRVALDGSGVVGLLVPNGLPDAGGLLGKRQSTRTVP